MTKEKDHMRSTNSEFSEYYPRKIILNKKEVSILGEGRINSDLLLYTDHYVIFYHSISVLGLSYRLQKIECSSSPKANPKKSINNFFDSNCSISVGPFICKANFTSIFNVKESKTSEIELTLIPLNECHLLSIDFLNVQVFELNSAGNNSIRNLTVQNNYLWKIDHALSVNMYDLCPEEDMVDLWQKGRLGYILGEYTLLIHLHNNPTYSNITTHDFKVTELIKHAGDNDLFTARLNATSHDPKQKKPHEFTNISSVRLIKTPAKLLSLHSDQIETRNRLGKPENQASLEIGKLPNPATQANMNSFITIYNTHSDKDHRQRFKEAAFKYKEQFGILGGDGKAEKPSYKTLNRWLNDAEKRPDIFPIIKPRKKSTS